MCRGAYKNHTKKIKENPKKSTAKSHPNPPSPPLAPPRSPAHCSVYALHCLPLHPPLFRAPALYRSTAARQVRAKWQVEVEVAAEVEVNFASRWKSKPKNNKKKKPKRFDLRQIWVICKG